MVVNTPDWIALLARRFTAASERLNPVRERCRTVKSAAARHTSIETSMASQTVSGRLKLITAGRLEMCVSEPVSRCEYSTHLSSRESFTPSTKPRTKIAVLQTMKTYNTHLIPIRRYILRNRHFEPFHRLEVGMLKEWRHT